MGNKTAHARMVDELKYERKIAKRIVRNKEDWIGGAVKKGGALSFNSCTLNPRHFNGSRTATGRIVEIIKKKVAKNDKSIEICWNGNLDELRGYGLDPILLAT